MTIVSSDLLKKFERAKATINNIKIIGSIFLNKLNTSLSSRVSFSETFILIIQDQTTNLSVRNFDPFLP